MQCSDDLQNFKSNKEEKINEKQIKQIWLSKQKFLYIPLEWKKKKFLFNNKNLKFERKGKKEKKWKNNSEFNSLSISNNLKCL